jgi:hypothetical protein
MLVFSLGTTLPHIKIDLTIENRTSQKLKLRITRDNGEYTEEFILHPHWQMELKTHDSGRRYSTPDEYLTSIAIYNDEGELLKEFNNTNYNEALAHLVFYESLNKSKYWRIYYFAITDELLE